MWRVMYSFLSPLWKIIILQFHQMITCQLQMMRYVQIKKSEKKHLWDLHIASVSFQSYCEICMLFLCLISVVYGNNSFSIGLKSLGIVRNFFHTTLFFYHHFPRTELHLSMVSLFGEDWRVMTGGLDLLYHIWKHRKLLQH